MKAFFRQAPFFRLIFPLVAGIEMRINFSFPEILAYWMLLLTLLITFCFVIIRKLAINYGLRWVSGVSIYLLVFCLGVLLTNKKIGPHPGMLSESTQATEMIGVISDPPEGRAKSVMCFVDVYQVKTMKGFTLCDSKMLVYIAKDSCALALNAGDIIVFKSSIDNIKSTGNPYEFDYRKYLSYQGIHHSGYANKSSWKLLARNELPFYQILAYHARSNLLSVFAKIGLTGDELGVASALIVGDKTSLDAEVKQAYIASGTMHILAVSGMHVALLYWVLGMLLSFLDRVSYGKFIKLFLLLSGVWFYALMTGLGGSILRAAIMITFVIIGQSFRRNISIFNSLAASAFVLLLINPFNLIDPGFQLSYFAVLGIVLFYPLIYAWFDIQTWLGNQLWSLTAVTLAAQILTTPITLFYFHQFPNLFLVSNLIMIPLSTLVMYFAMILIPFSGWDWLAGLLGKIFNFLVWLLNKVVITIEHLPYALTKGIYINWVDVCLLYMFICFGILYLWRKRALYFILSLSVIALLSFHRTFDKYQNFLNNEFVVYNDGKNIVLQFHSGPKSVWLVGERNAHVNRYIDVAISASECKENRVLLLDSIQKQSKGKGRILDDHLWVRGDFVQFHDKKIAIIKGDKACNAVIPPVRIDYLILREGDSKTAENAGSFYSAGLVVINPTITGSNAKRIEKIFLDKRVETYNIDNRGALRINTGN